jgi:hypothetical protein
LSTVIAACEVAVLPPRSRATALIVCGPLVAVRVFHESVYGAVLSSEPRLAPSSLNWTPTTPTSSDAVALSVVVSESVAPAAGAVSVVVGAVRSMRHVYDAGVGSALPMGRSRARRTCAS